MFSLIYFVHCYTGYTDSQMGNIFKVVQEYLMVKVGLKTKCFIPIENICHSTVVLCLIISL